MQIYANFEKLLFMQIYANLCKFMLFFVHIVNYANLCKLGLLVQTPHLSYY